MPTGIYIRTKKCLKNLSKSHKGKISGMKDKKHSEKTREKIRTTMKNNNLVGCKSSRWKGDDVGYSGLHRWIQYHLGKPTKCEHCKKDGLTGRQIGWANKDHKYKRNKKDWMRLCTKCHSDYDILNKLKVG